MQLAYSELYLHLLIKIVTLQVLEEEFEWSVPYEEVKEYLRESLKDMVPNLRLVTNFFRLWSAAIAICPKYIYIWLASAIGAFFEATKVLIDRGY